MDPDLTALADALADRYTLLEPVGSGGMATVYLARDIRHDRVVAVKVLRRELAVAIGTERFLREITIAARLTHPHILPLHDSGRAGHDLYYVMPFVDGGSLRDRLRRDGQLPIDDAVRIIREVGAGLAHAHAQGVVHRDIKPDNVMFNAGVAQLADFGIALALNSAGGERLTETGLSLGTPGYMSPEQASGESNLDGRSDIYSLACVLYELLAGQPPFVGPNAQSVMARHVTDPVPPITTVRPSVGDGIARALDIALAKVPMDRFPDPSAFVTALEAAPGGPPILARKAIAVIPFATPGSDSASADFGDGLTDDIVTGLAKLRGLQVVSRTSTRHLTGVRPPARLLGRELNARYLVEGTVRTAARDFKVTVQLIDAADDTQVWAEQFTGTMTEALREQDRVSRAVVSAINAHLGPAPPVTRSGRPISNVHAYECYLRARRDIWRFTEPAIIHALQYLQEALNTVGEDVLLYAGIAEAYFTFPHIAGNEAESCMDRVRDCARRIFDIEPDSALGHCLTGLVQWKEPDCLVDAVGTLRRSLVADPDNPSVLFWNGVVAATAGCVEEAQASAEQLRRIDPGAPRTMWGMGWHHLMRGDAGTAVDAYREACRLDPDNPYNRFHLTYALASMGETAEATAIAEALSKDNPSGLCGRLARLYKYALKGDRRWSLDTVTPQLKLGARWVAEYSLHLAQGLALIDERPQALEWLDNAVRRGFTNHVFLTDHSPFLGNLRDEPRFTEILTAARRRCERLDT